MAKNLGHLDDPQLAIQSDLASQNEICLVLSWDLPVYWLEPKDVLRLGAIVCQHAEGLECILSNEHETLLRLADSVNSHKDFIKVANTLKLVPIALNQPIPLQPIHIKKPWGQEIWFTGIESRGVCKAEDTPLPWLLSLAPGLVIGLKFENPILLKILDPYPTPVYGDMYFELHEKKQEVYIVTNIDEDAWPDGKGAIRYGFNADKMKAYSTTQKFLFAYKEAVTAYHNIRISIDSQLDEIIPAQGFKTREMTEPANILQCLSSLPPALLKEEQSLREQMESFTYMRALCTGDVIQVPCLTPHALQHGVRAIEFQTPHYERYIISFAQKVLTQNHWDTEEALAKVRLEKADEKIKLISDSGGCSVEEIVSFDTFKAYKIALERGSTYTLDLDTYSLIIGLVGKLQMNHQQLHSEESYYLTAVAPPLKIVNQEKTDSIFLLAVPC